MASKTDSTQTIYSIVAKLKERTPLFILSLHVFAVNTVFMDYQSDNLVPIMYLIGISFLCILWEGFHAFIVVAGKQPAKSSKWLFIIFTSITRYINFICIGLFTTFGNPLTYIITAYNQQFLTYSILFIVIVNYVLSQIEDYYWHDLMLQEDELDHEIDTEYGITGHI